ncbi:MAG TPA: hypothetical protein VME43_33135 [Bryobacteraceae bacterium]|nr:hypothetical protein [Bryobacteraceae bacterium]
MALPAPAGPFVYERLARTIDRAWLGRQFPAVEAEREFIRNFTKPLPGAWKRRGVRD